MKMLMLSTFLCATAPRLHATSIAYSDPVGGWRYAYEGILAGVGSPGNGWVQDALDGGFDRGGGSDSWDGSGLGGTFGSGNQPGGVEMQTDGGTNFLRVQDVGDPRDHAAALGYSPVDPSNRKLFFTHSITGDGVASAGNVLDAGVTLAFRARLAGGGLLDPHYSDTDAGASKGENGGLPGGVPWIAGSSGVLGSNGGKGMFGIYQSSGGFLSFSLAKTTDQYNDATVFGQSGLVMNSLNGSSMSATVDAWQKEGALNVLGISDSELSAWHEFWITIQGDASGGGTHRVDVYLDGSTTPAMFHVTLGDGSDAEYAGLRSVLAFGLPTTQQQGAMDVDYLAYVEGIKVPVVVPEPVGGGFFMLGWGLMLQRSRRSVRKCA